MTAEFTCELRPSQLNDTVRQFMTDMLLQTREVQAQRFTFTKSIAAHRGTVCYAERDFMADSAFAPFWQLADGGAALGELKSILKWENVPNLISAFLEVAGAADWARYGSNNKKHRHYFALGGETNRQTSTPLWRGDIPKARRHHSNTNLTSSINYYSRDFEVVNPHKHKVNIAADGEEEFRPDYVRFAPFICHTEMR